MKRFTVISALALVMGLLSVVSTPSAEAAVQTRTVLYGPFTIPAGTMGNPGMLTKVKLGVSARDGDRRQGSE
jgi:hypothetical protein